MKLLTSLLIEEAVGIAKAVLGNYNVLNSVADEPNEYAPAFHGHIDSMPEPELFPTDASHQSTEIRSPGLTFSSSFNTCLLNNLPTA